MPIPIGASDIWKIIKFGVKIIQNKISDLEPYERELIKCYKKAFMDAGITYIDDKIDEKVKITHDIETYFKNPEKFIEEITEAENDFIEFYEKHYNLYKETYEKIIQRFEDCIKRTESIGILQEFAINTIKCVYRIEEQNTETQKKVDELIEIIKLKFSVLLEKIDNTTTETNEVVKEIFKEISQGSPEYKNSFLFLRIEKKNKNNFLLSLELKSPQIEGKMLFEDIKLPLEETFFSNLNNFENIRRSRPNVRESNLALTLENKFVDEKLLGKSIYKSFFIGEIKTTFEKFYNLAIHQKINNLSLVISSDIPEILNIPFELINDGFKYFGLQKDNFSILRTKEKSIKDFKISGFVHAPCPLRILFITSLPEDLKENDKFLQLEKEQEELVKIISAFKVGNNKRALVDFIEIPSKENIKNALKEDFDIIHISGHGLHAKEGYLVLENENGETELTSGEEFAKLISGNSNLKMVVISACETARAEDEGLAGALLNQGIPAVLAMRYPVTDGAARTFTSEFYKNICAGKTIGSSIFSAKEQVLEFVKIEREKAQNKKQNIRIDDEWFTPIYFANQQIANLLDLSKKRDVESYYQKPEHYFAEGLRVGEGFVGRHKDIISLTNLIKDGHNSICIQGLGGLGKTTLAVRFADNYQRGKFQVIQYLKTINEDVIINGILNRLPKNVKSQLTQIMEGNETIDKLKFLFNNTLSKGNFIFLFDNFETFQDEETFKIKSASLKNFLAYFVNNLPLNNFIIFTSRYPLDELKLKNYSINEMTFVDTFKLITKKNYLSNLHLTEMRQLHKTLGGHPRIMEMLESYFKDEFTGKTDPTIKWEDVKDKFKKVQKDLDKEHNKKILFEVLWNKLEEVDKQILRQAAVFHSIMPVDPLLNILKMEEKEIINSLTNINKLSLIFSQAGIFYVYRLTANYVITKQTDNKTFKELHQKAARYWEEMTSKHKSADYYLQARQHYLMIEEFDKAAEIVIVIVEKAYITWGYWDLSKSLYLETLNTTISKANEAMIVHNLGTIFKNQGEYQQAIDYYNRSMKIEEELGNKSGIAKTLHQIGNIHFQKGDYQQAIDYYNRSLKIKEELEDKSGIAITLHQIGMIHQQKGDYQQAIDYYNRSLKIKEELGDKSGIAESLGQFGLLFLATKKPEKALKSFLNAFKIFYELHSPNVRLSLRDINRCKEILNDIKFKEILIKEGFAPEQFDNIPTENKQDDAINFIKQLTAQAISAKQMDAEKQKEIIKQFEKQINQLPKDAKEIKDYFSFLIAVANKDDVDKIRGTIDKPLWVLFENVRKETEK